MGNRSKVVLVGAGHVNLYLAARAKAFRALNADLTLIDPGLFWYSGMAAGQLVNPESVIPGRLDPQSLIENGGGQFIRNRVVALDPSQRLVKMDGGLEIPYDLVSLNLGSEVHPSPWNAHERVFPVKPISQLFESHRLIDEAVKEKKRLRIGIIGGGATGCELAGVLSDKLRTTESSITLWSRSPRLLNQFPQSASRKIYEFLIKRNVEVRLQRSVQNIDNLNVIDDKNELVETDLIYLANGLRAPQFLKNFGLPLTPKGDVRVLPTMQTLADSRIFAGGDCAQIEDHPLPKIGVFGVRAAPIIFENMARLLVGRNPIIYKPQKNFLAILNLGGQEGLATWGPFSWRGQYPLKIKNWIDAKFMQAYQNVANQSGN